MDRLAASDYEAQLDTTFSLRLDSPGPTAAGAEGASEDRAEIDLVLVRVSRPGSAAPDAARPFSLAFRGPSSPPLPQATYTLRHDVLGSGSLFLVPIADDGIHRTYEAVFT